MSDKLKRTLIGALVAVALAVAVSYGLISQQTADQIQTQANQTLGNDPSAPAPQQPAPVPQNPGTQTATPAGPDPQSPAPRP